VSIGHANVGQSIVSIGHTNVSIGQLKRVTIGHITVSGQASVLIGQLKRVTIGQMFTEYGAPPFAC
jgi:hypothetical protein